MYVSLSRDDQHMPHAADTIVSTAEQIPSLKTVSTFMATEHKDNELFYTDNSQPQSLFSGISL